MFRVTGGKGVQIMFENGWTISVQWGPGNYCDNHHKLYEDNAVVGAEGSTTAECAVLNPHGDLIQLTKYDQVVAHQTPAEVLALMVETAARPMQIEVGEVLALGSGEVRESIS